MNKKQNTNKDATDLWTAKIISVLPHAFDRNEAIPESLIGATIIGIGTFADRNLVEGGGIVLDYQMALSTKSRRIILAFNDVAMWTEMDFPIEPEVSEPR